MTVPGGDPEALEHHSSSIGFAFCVCPRTYPHGQHLMDFNELLIQSRADELFKEGYSLSSNGKNYGNDQRLALCSQPLRGN